MDALGRLRAAGATVADGPRLDGVRWLRIHRAGGVHYIAAGDTIGLARLADAMGRGRNETPPTPEPIPEPPPDPEPPKPKPGKPDTVPPPHPVKDTNPGQVVAEEARDKPKKPKKGSA